MFVLQSAPENPFTQAFVALGTFWILWLFWAVSAWVIAIGLVGAVARAQQRSLVVWVVIALAASPVLALLALAGMPERRRSSIDNG